MTGVAGKFYIFTQFLFILTLSEIKHKTPNKIKNQGIKLPSKTGSEKLVMTVTQLTMITKKLKFSGLLLDQMSDEKTYPVKEVILITLWDTFKPFIKMK